MAEHRDQLRAELIGAALRRAGAAPSDRAADRRRTSVLVAAALLLVVVAVGSLVRSDPVGAEVFNIQQLSDGTVVVEVIDVIKDPELAAAELVAAGFSVTLEAVPTPASLVGQIVATSAEPAPGNPTADLSTETDGQRVIGFRAEPGSLGAVTIFYGRPAREDEPYAATDTVPGCAELAREPVTDEIVRRIVAEHGPRIRWKDAGPPLREITLDDLDDHAVVISIIGLSSDAALVTVGDSSVARNAMSC